MKELLLKVLLIVVSTTFSALLFEVGYRVVHFSGGGEELSANDGALIGKVTLRTLIRQSKDKDIVYELKPGLNLTFQRARVTTNSIGIRSPEIAKEKAPGTKRILGLGDSIMFGWGVEDNEPYLRLIENALRAEGKAVEVLNFGVPGYNTAMEAATFLSRGAAYDPDAVILHFVNNDFDVPYFMLKPADPWALSHSYLWEYLASRLSAEKSNEAALVGMDMRGVERGDRSEVLKQYESMTGRAGAERALEQIVRETKRRNIPLFIVYGTTTPEQQSLLEEIRDRYGITLLPVRPAVERFFAGRSVTKEERIKALQLSSGDPHPNPTGHRLYAETILQALRASGF